MEENIESIKSENKQLEDLKLELEESERKYLLLYADFENYKKRTLKEREELKQSVKAETLSSIMEIDNEISIAFKMESNSIIKESLNIFINKLSNFLKSNGVEEVQTDEYDPSVHDVIHVIEDEKSVNEQSMPIIIDVASKGYKLNDKIIKYPKIIISK